MGWSTEAPTGRGAARDRWESLQALVSQAEAFAAARSGADLAGFVDELDRRATEQHAPVAEGVTLATLHAAKGLEWDAVFLCGVQEGSIPITFADTPAEVEEERRLLYVGLTRAREHLSISLERWPATPVADAPASRRASSAGLAPETASSADRGRRQEPAARPPAAVPAAGRCPTRASARSAAAATARRPTTRSCSTASRSGGLSPRRPRTRCRRTSCSPTRRSRRSPRSSPPSPAELQEISGIGTTKIERYGEALLSPFGLAASGLAIPKYREMPIKSFAPYRERSDTFL